MRRDGARDWGSLKKKRLQKKRLYTVLTCVFLAIFLISIGVVAHRVVTQKLAEKKFDELAAMTTEAVETETETEETGILEILGINVPEKNIDWDVLAEENEDIYAWIYIPNTDIDYPVLQHPTDDEYYLSHNLDGSEGYPGCIFSQSLNSKDFSDSNTVLYGHNMKNGGIFGELHNFEDSEFFEENPYFYVYMPEKTYVYEVYAVCAASNAHLLYAYDFTTEAGFAQYISDISGASDENAHVREGMEVNYGQKLLTLSTCVSGQTDKRWLVTAVLLNDE